jgi:hypothetical protein
MLCAMWAAKAPAIQVLLDLSRMLGLASQTLRRKTLENQLDQKQKTRLSTPLGRVFHGHSTHNQ